MGQTLSEPVTEKQSSTCQDSRYLVGSSCMQGWRVSMDDSHTHILSLPEDPGTAYFAVYDGHGGSNIAEYAGKHLHKFITARPEYHLGNIEEALKQGFLDLDQAMLEEDMLQEKVAGSTAVVVLIKDNTLYCANVGDSRSIASVRGGVEVLSYDHKPNNEEELRRITAGGGWVQLNRVNGNLALSRALGDYVFKRNYRLSPQEQIVTAFPDVQVRQLNDDWEFIVIACDGIWEVLSNEEVISFCRVRLLSGWEPAAVCEALMQRCLAPNCATGGLGCDNMTVLIICLAPFPRIDPAKSPKTPQEDSIECAKFPAKNEFKESKNELNESWEKKDFNAVKATRVADSNIGDVTKRTMTPEQPRASVRRSKVDDPNFIQSYKDALVQMEDSFDSWKTFFQNYPTSRNLKVIHKFRKTLNNVLKDQEALNVLYLNHEKRAGKVCVPLSGMVKNKAKSKKNKTKSRRSSVRPQSTEIERKSTRIHKKTI